MIECVRNDIYRLLDQGVMNQGQNLSLYFSRLCKEIDEPDIHEHEAKEKAINRMESGVSNEAFDLYRRAYNNWRKAWENSGNALCFEMSVRTPMVVGIGDQNIHEFGISLQHPWGTPFIPGTAVKGVTSMAARQSGDPNWRRNPNTADPDGKYAETVFGGINADRERTAGGIGFADAWWVPHDKKPFQADIVNVHYQSYYRGGGGWPDGVEAPVPVKFIVIKPETRFLFVLTGDIGWCKIVKQIVRVAAEERGFGAKTRVGYGRMQYVEGPQEVLDRLESMDTSELAELFAQRGQRAEYRPVWEQAVRKCRYTAELDNLFRKYRPAMLLLVQLKQEKPKDLKAAKKIRDHFSRPLPPSDINTSDPDIQAIFNFCLPLAANGIANTWLEAFAYGFDDMVRGKNFDDAAGVLIDHMDHLKKKKVVWPAVERILQDIPKLRNMTANECADLEEIAKDGS
jgi:CRISPR type III-B/RAMP module RAMP protein Cmr6